MYTMSIKFNFLYYGPRRWLGSACRHRRPSLPHHSSASKGCDDDDEEEEDKYDDEEDDDDEIVKMRDAGRQPPAYLNPLLE